MSYACAFGLFFDVQVVTKNIGISTCFVYQKDESFYTVTWACNVDGTPLLVAGGINGIIRVIDVGNEKIHKVRYFYNCSYDLSQ